MTARSLRRALLTCVATLAIAAPAAGAAAFGTPGASGAPSSYYGIDASSLHTGSGTTDADIDAVPGLRALLNEKAAREAQAAETAAPTVRVQRGTTDADIDAVPGLRAQVREKQAREAALAAAAPTAGTTEAADGFQWDDAAIGAAVALAALGACALVAVGVRRRDGSAASVA
jgi:hypothetical protein